nr:uncharacterized protein LOC128689046 [Cherax quadricarinatus]
MAAGFRRRVNTVCIDLIKGTIPSTSINVLVPMIIRHVYGIQRESVCGVALNGLSRIFVKFCDTKTYEQIVNQYQDVIKQVTPAVTVKLHDVSQYYTWVRVRNVPFEANKVDIRDAFKYYGTIHQVTMGRWSDGHFAGLQEGSFTLKMSLHQPIPSYINLEEFRTQVYVTYPGQRRTCRLCGALDHIAAQCIKRQTPSGRGRRPDGEAPRRILADEVVEDLPCLKSWSDEVDRAMLVESSYVTTWYGQP